ncbi:hypothetical protein [Streptomyces collinus]|uniref:hypothetical protein n=1 Tax=Streptomyces TaxID=1883 RepID=UPI003823144D
MNRDEVTAAVVAGRLAKGLTRQQLADAIGRPLVWTTAALFGQHPLPEDSARRVAELLDLPAEGCAGALRRSVPRRAAHRGTRPVTEPLQRGSSGHSPHQGKRCWRRAGRPPSGTTAVPPAREW